MNEYCNLEMMCYLCKHSRPETGEPCQGMRFENATKEQLIERLKKEIIGSPKHTKIIEVLKIVHGVNVNCDDETEDSDTTDVSNTINDGQTDDVSDEQTEKLKEFIREQIHSAFEDLCQTPPPPTMEQPKTPVDYGYVPPTYAAFQPVFYDGRSFLGNGGVGMEAMPSPRPRISKDDHFLMIAEAVAQRGTCLRRKFGAIIVNADGHIVSTGYVGAPRGRQNCCDLGTCYRMKHNIPSGERYEKCRSVHAEMNAIIQASSEEMKFSTLYLVGIENNGTYTNADCCAMCKRMIINAGINRVIARQADGTYTDTPVIQWIVEDDSLDPNHVGY